MRRLLTSRRNPRGSWRRRAALLAAGWGLLSAPGSVRAATVGVGFHPTEPVYGMEVVYTAGPGERNDVTVREVDLTVHPTGAWEVRDAGAVITPRENCWAVDEHTARCDEGVFSGSPIGGYRLRLGDGDDRLHVQSTTSASFVSWIDADGGPGDDVLFGGDSEHYLGERLAGGGGRDELHGEGGPDVLSDGDESGADGASAPRRDVLDGGPGRDMVSYGARTAPVTVDLADDAPDGERGERDVLSGIESVAGGHGDDRLRGDARANVLEGNGGRDRLLGRAGDDEFASGESTGCGRGSDLVRTGSAYYGRDARLGFLEPDCELIDPWHAMTLPAYPDRTRASAVTYGFECPRGGEDDEITACSGRIRLTEHAAPHRLLGIGRRRSGYWTDASITVRLTSLGRHLAARPDGVRADVRMTGQGFPAVARWTIRLTTRN